MTVPGRLFDPDDQGPEPTRATATAPSGEVIARVVPDVSGLDREFDYRADADRLDGLAVGSLVQTTLGGRSVQGWVTAIDTEPAGEFDLRPLTKVLSAGPTADLVDLARWTARRWSGRLGAVLRTASPPRRIPPVRVALSSSRPQSPLPVTVLGPADVVLVRHGPNDDLTDWFTAVAARGSAVVVMPRLGPAHRLAGQLRRRGVAVRVHPQDWAAAAGRGGVVIGARSAVWARVPDLGSVVVIDEHDEALQEERNPTWHARDVAIERARRAGVPCLLFSPCPSVAGRTAADRVLEPARESERASWPVVEVVDRRRDEPGRRGLFSARVAGLVRSPGSVLAVLNRKGRAVMLACAICGELARTEDGDRLMVERDGALVCPATGETRPVVCAVCGATKLKRLRLGVARAAEELAALAGEPVAELTGPPRGDGRPPTRVVVGTEAALHQLTGVGTVVFLDFDAELLAPRYRAAEQAMSLLVMAARLTGPRGQGGRVVVQTRSPDHRVLHAAVRADPARFGAAETEVRRSVALSPFGALAELSGAGSAELASRLDADPTVTVLGPRHDGRYLVRAPTPDDLATALAAVGRPAERVRVAVDPPRA